MSNLETEQLLASESQHATDSETFEMEESVIKPPTSTAGQFVYRSDLDNVKRQLGRQHIQMIALAGTLGTGLFVGLGTVLALAGPAGSLILYILASTVVYGTIMAVGELTAYAPVSGSLLHYAARWLDPAVGFALGWNYFYFTAIAIPLELTALISMVMFWDENPNHIAIYIAAVIVALFLINLFGVKWFGNSEIFFSALRIILVIGLIIGGLAVSLGGGPDHEVIGFRYWKNPGPFVSELEPGATGRFLSLLVAISTVGFSLSGVELISIAAAEAKQPRTNIIIAMKTVIFRLVFFFLLSVIVVGMLVPSNDPSLLRPGESAGQSPFVIAFTRAGIKVLPSIINAVLITVAFSAANTIIFTSSRVLYGLAVQGRAPKILTTCNKDGMPWVATIVAWSFSFLTFLNVSSSSGSVFSWFVSISATCGFISWLTINTTYLRFYFGLKRQGIVPRGIYRSPLQPYISMWAIFWIVLFTLMNGISVFWDWSASQFVASYINIPVFFCLCVGYKVWHKTKMVPLVDLDFISNIPSLEETEDEGLLTEKPSFMKQLKDMI